MISVLISLYSLYSFSICQPALPKVEEQGEDVKPKKRKSGPKRQWTNAENKAFVECLVESVTEGGWKAEGQFKAGFPYHVEKMLKLKLSGSNFKVYPHINSM